MLGGGVDSFSEVLRRGLGISLRPYQRFVAGELLGLLGGGVRFAVVSMPTGSGKTLIEILTAYRLLRAGLGRVLVLEPTRFLCDQMCFGGGGVGPWKAVFGERVSREYEGRCGAFLAGGVDVVISTPQTALKCVSELRGGFKAVIIDEVHHAFGGRYYSELLTRLRPEVVAGFTALLPRYRRYRLDPAVRAALGEPRLLTYDFRRLEEIDPGFRPPKAVADLFDAEFSGVEREAYDALFRAEVPGLPASVKHLELTLARYGRAAACESYVRAVRKGRVARHQALENLCLDALPSHKARALAEVLQAYGVEEGGPLSPTLIFTSRKATAREFARVATDAAGIPEGRVGLLTSDLSRGERKALIRRAREGGIDVIVSTIVGEEGVDIPEAGLLIMADVPRSSLRFYQRLGRLIRVSSPRRMKYMVSILTPETVEYRDLDRALQALYSEGVDVSYILANAGDKTLTCRVAELVEEALRRGGGVAAPYLTLTLKQPPTNPLEYLVNLIRSSEEAVRLIKEGLKESGLAAAVPDDIESQIYLLLTIPILRYGNVKKALKLLRKVLSRGRLGREVSHAIREGRILYIYDVDALSKLLSKQLLLRTCMKRSRHGGRTISRVDLKPALMMLAKLLPRRNAGEAIKCLERRFTDCVKHLERLKEAAVIKSYSICAITNSYSRHTKLCTSQLLIDLETSQARVYHEAQISYYDLSEEVWEDKVVRELIEANLRAVGCETLRKLIETLPNSWGR